MENKVHFKLHKVKKHWVTIAASSLAIGALFVGIGHVGADELTADTTTQTDTESVATDNEIQTTTSLITSTEHVSAASLDRPTSINTTINGSTLEDPTLQTNDDPITNTSEVSPTTNEYLSTREVASPVNSVELTAETLDTVNTNTKPTELSEHPLSGQELPIRGGSFTSDNQGNWYYTKDGKNLTGWNNVDQREYYFQPDGKQVKGQFIEENGKTYYLDENTGVLWVNRYLDKDGKHYQIDENGVVSERTTLPVNHTGGQFIANDKGEWSYVTSNGDKLTGFQYVDGVELYFDENGKQIKGQTITVDGNTYYLDKDSGALLKNNFYNWYKNYGNPVYRRDYHQNYFDRDGKRVTGLYKTSDGYIRYFDQNGDLAQDKAVTIGDTTYVFGYGGRLLRNMFLWEKEDPYFPNRLNFYYADSKGHAVKGLQSIDGHQLYFDDNGRQVKDKVVTVDGKNYYFDKDNGRKVSNQWVTVRTYGPRNESYSSTYYIGEDGSTLTGLQTLDGKTYFFSSNGDLTRNARVKIGDSFFIFNQNGELVRNAWYTNVSNGTDKKETIFRTDDNGKVLSGKQTIDGKDYLLDEEGTILDNIVTYEDQKYLVHRNEILKNTLKDNIKEGKDGYPYRILYGTNDKGVLLEGIQKGSDGQLHYFQPEIEAIDKPIWKEIDGKQYRLVNSDFSVRYFGPVPIALSNITLQVDGKVYHFDDKGVASEIVIKNQFIHDESWNWYYYDKDGKRVTGFQTIDGVQLYFDKNGKQAKNTLRNIDGDTYYFDENGAKWVDRPLELNGVTYSIDKEGHVTSTLHNRFTQDRDGDWLYFNEKGQVATGWQVIDGVQLYFDGSGKQAKGKRILIEGNYYYFDKDSGKLLKNAFQSMTPKESPFYFGENGAQVFGWYTIDGKRAYFDNDGYQVKSRKLLIDDSYYYITQDGYLLVNSYAKTDRAIYVADENGKLVTGWRDIDGKTYYLDPQKTYTYYIQDSLYTPEIRTIDGKNYLLGKYGRLIRNQTGYSIVTDENGVVRTGFYRTSSGYLCYLEPKGAYFSEQDIWREINGKLYHFQRGYLFDGLYASKVTTNTTLEKDGNTYVIDNDGVATLNNN